MPKKTQNKKKEKIEFDYQKIFDFSPEAIVVLSNTGKFIKANSRIYDWLGYKPETLVGKSLLAAPFFPLESKKIIAIKFWNRIRGKKVDPYVVKFIAKNKKEKYGKIVGVPIKNAKGKIILDLVMITDVTKEHSLELKLGESQSEKGKLEAEVKKRTKEIYDNQIFLNNIIEQSPFSTWIADEKGTNIRINKACKNLFGIKNSKDVVGKYNLFKDELLIKNKLISKIRSVFKQGKVINFQIDYPFELVKHVQVPGAKRVLIDVTIFPIKNSQGKVANAVVQHRDITASEQAEDKIKESEKKYRSLYLASHDAIMTLEPPNWNFTAGNPAAIKMFGVKDEKEFISLGPGDLSPKEQLDGQLTAKRAKEVIGKAMREGSNFFEWTHKRYRGENFQATISLIRVGSQGKQFLQATVRDITEKQLIEKQAQKREKLLESVSIIAQELLKSDEWSKKIQIILNILGKSINTSRIYIFKNLGNEEKNLLATQTNEWIANKVGSQMSNPELIRFSYQSMGFSRWLKALSQKKMISGNIKDFPKKELVFLKKQNIKSILIMPIFIEDDWWGFIGFDECRQERQWTKSEISVLNIIKQLIESSLKQENFSENLEKELSSSEKMNHLMIGRELKMMELKKEIRDLKK
jgi:PAS domain S-box-containing protein